MPTHTVTLNWGPAGFRPDMDPLFVETGDTISFQLGAAPPNSTFKITMKDRRFFAPAEVADSHTSISVVKAEHTTYDCQLLDANGGSIALSSDDQGGHVKPGKSG
jgi:hypothetical protein